MPGRPRSTNPATPISTSSSRTSCCSILSSASTSPRPSVEAGAHSGQPPATTTPVKTNGLRSVGVELALMQSRFEGVVRAMLNTLLRSARTAVLGVAHDFSCCILTAEGQLFAWAESIPIHTLRGPDLMSDWMHRLHPGLKRGDAFLNNSPYHGNTHAADWSILVPVVDTQGVHRFTVVAKAHQGDCGNAKPTTYEIHAKDVYEEGA